VAELFLFHFVEPWGSAEQYLRSTVAGRTSNLTPYTVFEFEICGRTKGQTKVPVADSVCPPCLGNPKQRREVHMMHVLATL
jgi:hypothetical protein